MSGLADQGLLDLGPEMLEYRMIGPRPDAAWTWCRVRTPSFPAAPAKVSVWVAAGAMRPA